MRHIILLLVSCTVPAFAQDPIPAAPVRAASSERAFGLPLNSRVRVTISEEEIRRLNATLPPRERLASRPLIAYIVGIRGDSVALQSAGAVKRQSSSMVTRVIAISQVERVDVSRGNHRRRNVGIGAAVGAGLGLAAGIASGESCNGDEYICVDYAVTVPLLTLVGAGAGAGFGMAASVERWSRVHPPNTAMRITPHRGGARVGFDIAFR